MANSIILNNFERDEGVRNLELEFLCLPFYLLFSDLSNYYYYHLNVCAHLGFDKISHYTVHVQSSIF